VTPPPPLDPNDPRAGDPTKISTWFTIGGTIIIVVIIGTVTWWNSGKGGGAKPTPIATGSTVTGPPTSDSAPSGTYKIIFDGVGDGRYEVPNNTQIFRSNTTHATWHLEYTFGGNSNDLPDPATEIVKGNGFYSVYSGNSGCRATDVKYAPNVSILKRIGGGETFSLVPPLAGDLTSAAGCTPNDANHATGDPFYLAWNATCGVPCPDDLGAFETATFTIRQGQTGTVATPFSRKFHHKNLDRVYTLFGAESTHSWSGTITVIAQ
jgi:hypothetical protein